MIDFTPIARPWLVHRAETTRRIAGATEQVQRRVLDHLLNRGRRTAWGEAHDYRSIKSYEDYCRHVPVAGYDHVRPYVMRMIDGEKDVLWPGICRRFAQSSGTSDGKSKYIPITDESLHANHFAGATDVVAFYLANHPESRLFSGKAFILGGSYANDLTLPPKVHVGDLSATLIDCINPLANLMRIPSKRIALMEHWEEKLPQLVEASLRADVTNLSGVPSWFLTVLKEVMAAAGASCIHDVWPNLEVFFHGGISFKPYREQYKAITRPERMHYVETYNASEGFFALQDDPASHAMLLLLDRGVFYEFVPLDQIDEPFPEAVPAWKVEPGKTYAMIISAPNGLWRYAIGDTVRIESVDPLRISIAGRTRHYINAFGEELMVYNADAAIEKTCAELGCSIANYHAAPVFASSGEKGHHQWLIEWNTPPSDIDTFARSLDSHLQQENSDYQAKRHADIFLSLPDIVSASPGLFDRWLASSGKLGGQRKIPRLSNDRSVIDRMLEMNHPTDKTN